MQEITISKLQQFHDILQARRNAIINEQKRISKMAAKGNYSEALNGMNEDIQFVLNTFETTFYNELQEEL